ncbi:uncharacterized protein LOC143193961 [Rhynchophorus ferrugineus]|uniref:Uncharacterized protein n=1 Tax=Rhynchophorus ferrugineus TaxID=354439 RepID=A0A834HTS3_RHYFE|nr:hypothetical protein GWI33_020906 [Rhynchophorus ferrugineus]
MANLNYFINSTNPEIFSIVPRPGGFANIPVPEKTYLKPKTISAGRRRSRSRADTSGVRRSLIAAPSAEISTGVSDYDACPRQYKISQIIAATPWSVEFDEFLEPSEYSARVVDPFQDSVDMLAMTISIIMLLSKGYDKISESHFKWTLSYLKCIKDEFGQTPPNIQGILNHINQVTGGQITSFLEGLDDSDGADKKFRISESTPDVAEG